MPLYRFRLRAGRSIADDPEAMDLPGASAAEAHAREVARELMANRESGRRHWTIEVHDDNGIRLTAVLFASVDPTLDHLAPNARQEIVRLNENIARANELVSQARRLTLRMMSMSHRAGKPRLVALKGYRDKKARS